MIAHIFIRTIGIIFAIGLLYILYDVRQGDPVGSFVYTCMIFPVCFLIAIGLIRSEAKS
jgi:hypothetical protein